MLVCFNKFKTSVITVFKTYWLPVPLTTINKYIIIVTSHSSLLLISLTSFQIYVTSAVIGIWKDVPKNDK